MARVQESAAQLRARIERGARIRQQILAAIEEIRLERQWPSSLNRLAQEVWCEFAAKAARNAGLPKVWAGATHSQRVHGALSSLQVLLNERKPFIDDHGRAREGLSNRGWVLDCWEVALKEWAARQPELIPVTPERLSDILQRAWITQDEEMLLDAVTQLKEKGL